MSYQKAVGVVVFVLLCSWGASRAIADMGASEKDTAVRKMGVAFNIADDRRMENISGIYQPEGLDKYMKRYFDELSAKVDQLIDQNNRLAEKLDELRSQNGQSLGSQRRNNP